MAQRMCARARKAGVHYRDLAPVHFPGVALLKAGASSIINATMRAERLDMLVTRAIVELEDANGDKHTVYGKTIAGAPWYNFNPSSAAFQTLMHWQCGNLSGHSHIADFVGLGYMSRGMADQFSTD